MASSAEEGAGHGFEPTGNSGFAEEAVLHEARGSAGGGVVVVDVDELLEIGQDHAEGSAGTEIGEDVSEGETEFVEGHVLEDVRAVDCFGRLRRDRKTFDDVAILNVFGIGRKAFFHEQRSEKGKAALQPESGTCIEVLPGFRSTHATTKLHIPVIHGRIIHSVERGFGVRERRCSVRYRGRMKSQLFKICQFPLLFVASAMAHAQQPIGTVGVQDATVAGALEVSNGRAILVGNTTVTARDRVAEIELNRGGTVHVCATSGLHVTAGKSADGAAAPLMLALDRGAIEVQMAATARDVVTTPDLRFTMQGDGPLDLQLRVTRNGDTCVENRGAKAPGLSVADQFGEATYELRAGQHVLFEHGSLKEVVDHESSVCGCPPEPTMSVADGLSNSAAPGGGAAEKTATEQHPFPAAVSAGLSPATVPQAAAGAVHTQVSAALSSGGGADSLAEPAAAKDTTAGDAKSATGNTTGQSAPPLAKSSKNPFRAVGRFFRRVFGGR
jgi:hypothetical protein